MIFTGAFHKILDFLDFFLLEIISSRLGVKTVKEACKSAKKTLNERKPNIIKQIL
jgi:hypothetical protein